ncbi:hypothetical protein MCOR27_003757 [Pyricularia oryzae]|uniref:Uncharacterized protein n=2 Tax=Pyricularia TaxID=48558 RepID=A0ABQ8NKV5_PYRGI|nr:hypothetical protein MCOR02_005859 [Pyricularia oryzae]KAI6298685.1 hypothetical protein MCOR33_005214 [Pyricularia grisea]KAI6253166.1 hypothetical protein MCOR19_010255 [Pyricularia oryzae]KAI6282354.1 hypothetical protein MCOR27_003757 [Pyricularia oryzae]KAI6305173.1 hypothetical protein MCOR29_010612 [Pyricularia oryzae]
MRFNHFLLPLMAGSVVSAPVREPEPKHQLEARMNVGTVVTSGLAVCVAGLVGTVTYKTYQIAVTNLQYTKGQYDLAKAKFALDEASVKQAMKIASDNQQQAIGQSIMDRLTKTVDLKSKLIDDNVQKILKAEPKNEFASEYQLRVNRIQQPYLKALERGALQYPVTLDTSEAIAASKRYCAELDKLIDDTNKEMESVVNKSPKSSPAGSAEGSPSRSTSPDGRNPTSGGTTGLTRTNSQSGRPPSSDGSVSPTNDRGRTQSVVSSNSAGSAGTKDLSKAEKGKAGIPMQNLPTSQGKTSGASVPAPGPAAGLTRRPTEGQLRRTGSTASLKSGTKTLRRRMVPLVVFDV